MLSMGLTSPPDGLAPMASILTRRRVLASSFEGGVELEIVAREKGS
jgi:hypothetical protein